MSVLISRKRAIKLLASGQVALWESSDTGGDLAPGAYVVLKLKSGGEHIVFMTIADLQREAGEYLRKQAEIEQRKAAKAAAAA